METGLVGVYEQAGILLREIAVHFDMPGSGAPPRNDQSLLP